VDRVTGLDAAPRVERPGTIWTETDVHADAWYLHHGVMPAGLMMEAGQADLALAAWMGADFHNRGERAYRLLGCDLCFHGGLARAGETLSYQIEITGHARQGDVRLMFFRYDCTAGGELRMTVRNAQAGFFTDRELAESGGILWSPETAAPAAGARRDPPRVKDQRSSFGPDALDAFYDGRPADCFGPAYDRLRDHARPPRPAPDRLRLLDEVTHCEARGGPWGRGYLRARKVLSPRAWFFDGHFLHDPCMPGTLMFEATLQALAFYLTWMGYSLDRDGWRFEPVPGAVYPLRCRGQVSPASRELVLELFVEEVHDGPQPTVFVDFLGTVDGLKAFHCRRMGLWMVSGGPAVQPAGTAGRLDRVTVPG
jgi:3-hydroxymyristoyl/3-hydroxydecanoyl-(acyl carrier protein) dehydratase